MSKRTREVAMSLPAMTVRMDGPPGKERCEIMVTVRNCRQSEAVDVATTQAARLIDLAQLRLLGGGEL